MTNLTEEEMKQKNGEKYELIIKRAILDKKFRERFISSPREIFDEIGVIYPEGYKFKIIELEPKTMPIPLPPYEGKV